MLILEAFRGALEVALADETPGSDDVGDDVDDEPRSGAHGDVGAVGCADERAAGGRRLHARSLGNGGEPLADALERGRGRVGAAVVLDRFDGVLLALGARVFRLGRK